MMYPKVIVGSVIRGAVAGEAHGGLYLLDMNTEEIIPFDEFSEDIDFNGNPRGGERGIRGCAVYNGCVYSATGRSILKFDENLNRVDEFKHDTVKNFYESAILNDKIYFTSVVYDSIISFDLKTEKFDCAYRLIDANNVVKREINSLEKKETIHLNNVYSDGKFLYYSGYASQFLMKLDVDTGECERYGKIPHGTHNCRPYKDGIISCHTVGNVVLYSDKTGKELKTFPVKMWPESEIIKAPNETIARQGWLRGLATTDDYVIAGSSPSTITLYDFNTKEIIKSIRISKDVRNCLHGLVIYEN